VRVSSASVWVPLLVAGIGLIGALSGGVVGSVLTQRQADKRENIAWARERERQQEERDREDRARTFEHRREAYLDFYVAVKALARTAYNHSYGFTEPELAEGWQDDAFSKLHCLEFYADRELAALHRRHMARLGPGASTGSTTTLMTPTSTSASSAVTMLSWSWWGSCAGGCRSGRATWNSLLVTPTTRPTMPPSTPAIMRGRKFRSQRRR